jgi:hypothetical protein
VENAGVEPNGYVLEVPSNLDASTVFNIGAIMLYSFDTLLKYYIL